MSNPSNSDCIFAVSASALLLHILLQRHLYSQLSRLLDNKIHLVIYPVKPFHGSEMPLVLVP
jgi:hypothetical protein